MAKRTSWQTTTYYAGRLTARSIWHIRAKCTKVGPHGGLTDLYEDVASMARDQYGSRSFAWWTGEAVTRHQVITAPQSPEGLTILNDTAVSVPRFMILSVGGGGGHIVHLATGWAVSGLCDKPAEILKLINELDFSEPEISQDENGTPYARWTANTGRTIQRNYWRWDLFPIEEPIRPGEPSCAVDVRIGDDRVRALDTRWGLHVLASTDGYVCFRSDGVRLFTVPLTVTGRVQATARKWIARDPLDMAIHWRDQLLYSVPDLGTRRDLADLKDKPRQALGITLKVMRDQGAVLMPMLKV